MSNYNEVMESLKSVPSVTEHLNSSQVKLGKELLKHRMELGLTQDDFVEVCEAKGLSITQSILSGIESGTQNVEVKVYQDVLDVLSSIQMINNTGGVVNMEKDIKKALLFGKEIYEIEKKYGMKVSATYEEEFDWNHEGEMYPVGGESALLFTDENGHEYSYYEVESYEEKLNDLIGEWHDSDSELSLHEYLGFTWEEYKVFVGKVN